MIEMIEMIARVESWPRIRRGGGRRRLLPLVFTLATILSPTRAQASGGVQYWSQGYVEVSPEKSKLRLGIYGEVRTTERALNVLGIFVGPTLSYEILPYLQTSVSAKLLVLRMGGEYEQWQRLDLELTPKPPRLIGGHLGLGLRNRAELFRHPASPDAASGVTSTTIRARHRLEIDITLDRAWRLKKIYVNNEWFWGQHFRHGSLGFTENRLTPLGLQFEVSSFARLNVFYLVQLVHDEESKHWRMATCVGTFLTIQPARAGR